MFRISRRSLLGLLGAQACGAVPQADPVPAGARPVWDLAKAHRESTPARERVCINGLWRWQPAMDAGQPIPADGWGLFRVPESWPAGRQRATAAWYQRTITIPADWTGRRITLSADYLNSFATVYIDGAKAGEMRYPGGELDLTRWCHPGQTYLLTMLVLAMPLKAVMLSYSDTASARTVEGNVARRGLCGDVWLNGMPSGPRIADVQVETSVRKWQLTLNAAIEALDPAASYRLRARIYDGDQPVTEFASPPFLVARSGFTWPWKPAKLWDTHTPQNQYRMSVSLEDGTGTALDTAFPIRFGFREFWIDGRDFYINGSRIYLSATPLDSAQDSTISASYEATRATLQHFKSFGVNFVYTHNYGCEPGTHFSFEDVLRAADDEGMLVAFSQPHFGQYDWTAPDADTANGYAQHAPFYVRIAQNHPSVVCYSTSHNGAGYSEDMNPDLLDGVHGPRDQWSARGAQRALRAEAIIRRLDSSRIVYHHSGGNLGAMHTVNFYGNWIPPQEMSDWFEHWSTAGVKPLFTCEYAVPFMWDWSMYRGWFKGKREFGSAVAPWELHVAEWDAQTLGDSAYRISPEEAANLRWEADQFRKGRTWQRWDYPYNLGHQVFEDRLRVMAMQVAENWRAFRTWGLSANGAPWDIENYWKRPPRPNLAALEIDWDNLQRPGTRPTYVREDEVRARLAFRPDDYRPTAVAQALYRNNMPLLGYFGGRPEAFTSQDHNFRPGQAVEKQVILINNARTSVTARCRWSLQLPKPAGGTVEVTLQPGQQKRIPLRFDLPAELVPGRYELRGTFAFPAAEAQQDSFAIDVMPRAARLRTTGRIALFDPAGETARSLTALGVGFTPVDAGAALSTYDTLVVGKGALTPDGAAPDIARVRDGLKVIVFEQTGAALEKRLGFRVAEYGLRRVFPRVPGHPLLARIAEQHLRNWRGASTLLAPRLEYELGQQFNMAPTVKWAGIPVTRVWRAGNRGSVASALIEKPACGDFLSVVDGGYALQYASLMEYREGRGMVLFCQLDLNGRTENDPAAETILRNILGYVATWKPSASRTVAYSGDPAGRSYLQSAGISPVDDGEILVFGPGAARNTASASRHVLAIGLEESEANALLPVKVGMAPQEHIAAYFSPFGPGSPFTGISPADVHNRDPRKLPLVTRGATIVGNGVLAAVPDAGVVFSQLAPWQFDYSGGRMNVKRTFRNVARLTARLLGNLGASSRTPLLSRFSTPAGVTEKRWLDGLYLDVPEEWDDPYRFFRW